MTLGWLAPPPAAEGRLKYRDSNGVVRAIRCHACDTRSSQPVYVEGAWRSMCCLLPIEDKDFAS